MGGSIGGQTKAELVVVSISQERKPAPEFLQPQGGEPHWSAGQARRKAGLGWREAHQEPTGRRCAIWDGFVRSDAGVPPLRLDYWSFPRLSSFPPTTPSSGGPGRSERQGAEACGGRMQGDGGRSGRQQALRKDKGQRNG